MAKDFTQTRLFNSEEIKREVIYNGNCSKYRFVFA